MILVNEPQLISIIISNDGKELWINDELQLLLRAYKIHKLIISDTRQMNNPEENENE